MNSSLAVVDTAFPDVKLIPLQRFPDDRGYFMESFQQRRYAGLPGLKNGFVQDNVSCSRRDVLRGLHFQREHAQGKLLRVVQGVIYDVTVDVRRNSPTFGQWQGITLAHEQFQQLWIPPGYAHGFMVLSEQAVVNYKCTEYYHPEDEVCLRWNDGDVGVQWPAGDPIVSARDRAGLGLAAILEQGLCL